MADLRDVMPPESPWFERLIGARIVSVEQHRNDSDVLIVVFAHRGTDDDAGYLRVSKGDVNFGSDLV